MFVDLEAVGMAEQTPDDYICEYRRTLIRYYVIIINKIFNSVVFSSSQSRFLLCFHIWARGRGLESIQGHPRTGRMMSPVFIFYMYTCAFSPFLSAGSRIYFWSWNVCESYVRVYIVWGSLAHRPSVCSVLARSQIWNVWEVTFYRLNPVVRVKWCVQGC